MILNKEECYLFVHNGSIGIFVTGKLIQQIKHHFHKTESHYLRLIPNSSFYLIHNFVYIVQCIFNMSWICSPYFYQELNTVHSKFWWVYIIVFSSFQTDFYPVINCTALKQLFSTDFWSNQRVEDQEHEFHICNIVIICYLL